MKLFQHFTLEQRALAFGVASLVTCAFGVKIFVPFVRLLKILAEKTAAFWSRDESAVSFIEIAGVKLTDNARMRHTHIVGATGSGKTVLMEQLIYHDLERGYGALIIDPKGERDLFERVQKFCQSIGRENDLHLLSSTYLSESSRWNPCRLGSTSELQSKFYSSCKYEHSFYAKAAELALMRSFDELGAQDSDNLLLSDLVTKLNELSHSGKDENLKGLYFDIQNLAYGEWGPVLGTAGKIGRTQEISLLDIARRNEILFVDLPTEGKVVQSARVGALLLQELTLISGLRKRFPFLKSNKPFSVFVDEFDAFATDPFATFLNKGRSSGFMIHMAHQTLSDLAKVSPTFQGQIMGNPNIRFVFRVDNADDVEELARQFGTVTVTKNTSQTDGGQITGRGSTREAEEFLVHPNRIKTFGIGECVIGIKTDQVLKEIKIPFQQCGEGTLVPFHRRPMPEHFSKNVPISQLSDVYSDVIPKGENQ